MKPVELVYLSQEDIIGLKMPMGEVITIVENVFREHGLGHFENPPKPGIHPQPDAFIHGMPGDLPRQKAAASNGSAVFPVTRVLAFRRAP